MKSGCPERIVTDAYAPLVPWPQAVAEIQFSPFMMRHYKVSDDVDDHIAGDHRSERRTAPHLLPLHCFPFTVFE